MKVVKGSILTIEDDMGSCALVDSKNGNLVAICDSQTAKMLFDKANIIGSYDFICEYVSYVERKYYEN